MKKLILLIITIFTFYSCNTISSDKDGVIYYKNIYTYSGNKLPDGLCRYAYFYSGYSGLEFCDSCNKYNILDTLH